MHSPNDIFDFISKTYLDRLFASADGVEPGTPVRPAKLKQLRARRDEPFVWDVEARKPGTEANQIAYELSIAIERLGLAAHAGLIPMNVLLPLAADQLIEDWLLVHAWLRQYRGEEKTTAEDGTHFHRRHAEWLVLTARRWLATSYPSYPPLQELDALYADGPATADECYQALVKSRVDPPARGVRAVLAEMFEEH